MVVWLALPAVATDHAPPPIQPATSFAAVEVHEKEKVAIAAEPYDSKQKESIFRVDYLGHGSGLGAMVSLHSARSGLTLPLHQGAEAFFSATAQNQK